MDFIQYATYSIIASRVGPRNTLFIVSFCKIKLNKHNHRIGNIFMWINCTLNNEANK